MLTAAFWILHIGLAFIHTALLAVGIPHLEHRYVITLGPDSDRASTIIVVVSQSFAVIYLALTTITCLRLSLQRSISKRLTLTDVHDQMSAWSGLASAVQSLLQQGEVPSTVSIYLITLYLTCMAVLHTTTPALLNVETFNYTLSSIVTTSASLPGQSLTHSDYQGYINWYIAGQTGLPLLKKSTSGRRIGTLGNIVYDVIGDNYGTNPILVNASRFDVSCGYIPSDNITTSYNGNLMDPVFTVNISSIDWQDNVTDVVEPAIESFQFIYLAPIGMLFAPLGTKRLKSSSANIYVISTFPFVDVKKSSGNPIPTSEIPQSQNDTSHVFLSIAGCSVTMSNITVKVDPKDKTMLTPPARGNISTWQPWRPKVNPQSTYERIWSDVITSALPQLESSDSSTSDVFAKLLLSSTVSVPTSCNTNDSIVGGGNNSFGCFMSYVENAVIDNLVDPVANVNVSCPFYSPTSGISPCPLYGLENSLGDLTALLYWSAAQLNFPDGSWLFQDTSEAVLPPLPIKRQSSYYQNVTASRLNLHLVIVSIGFSTSLLLCVVASLLTLHRNTSNRGKGPMLSSVGLLQTIWLLHDHPLERKLVGAVADPSHANLRKAGKIPIDWFQRSNKGKGEKQDMLQQYDSRDPLYVGEDYTVEPLSDQSMARARSGHNTPQEIGSFNDRDALLPPPP